MGQKIVLITGAGASVPYNHPIGSQLVNIICDELQKKSSKLYRFLSGNGRSDDMSRIKYGLPSFHKEKIEEFRRKFIMAGSYSIDEFLSFNFSEFGIIGKLCVAFILRSCETFENIHPVGTEVNSRQNQDWIKSFLNNHFPNGPQSEDINNLTHITFNYDRVFEQKLFDFFVGRYGSLSQDKWNEVSKIRSHHIYGQLGPFPWDLTNKREPWNDFGFKKEDNYWEFQVQASARDIRVFTEKNQRDAPLPIDYFDHIYNAEKIFFLGFGFNEVNLERLGVDWKRIRGKVYGTMYKASNKDDILKLCKEYHIDISEFKDIQPLELLGMKWKEEVKLKPEFSERESRDPTIIAGGKTIVQRMKDGDLKPKW